MKKLLIASAIVATFAAPQAFAQAKNFEGFSVLGAVNVNNNKVEVPSSSFTESKTESNVGIQAEYDIPLGQSFVLGLGASAGLSDFSITSTTKLKNGSSVYIAPGFAVNQNTLVYGKVASVSTTVTNSAGSLNLSGVGYGAGARFLSGKNVFFQVEYMFNKYDDKADSTNTVLKNQTGTLSFGVGYKF